MSVLLTAVTDNEVMYIYVDKKYEIYLYVTVNSLTLTKNVTERTLCHAEYAIQNCNIFVFINMC